MKKIIVVLVLFSLISFSFAMDCDPKWTDEVDVRVLDAKNRPLQNASVTLTYQIDETTSKGYVTTDPMLTDEEGKIHKKVQNLEQDATEVDCDIVINVEYGGKTAQETVFAGYHATLIDINLDVYTVAITVLDQDGTRLENALISVDLLESHTNSNGVGYLRVGSGEKTLFVTYSGAVREYTFTVEDDMDYEVSFYVTDLILTVLDDQGNPLEATATFGVTEYEASNGVITIPSVGISDPEVLVSYQGREKYPELDLDRENEYLVVFDFNSPEVTSVKEQHTDQLTTLLVTIDDVGIHPSGIDPTSFSVRFDAGPGWSDAQSYPKGGNLYAAELGPIPSNTLVYFEIYVEDNDGNGITQPGQISIVDVPVNGNGGNQANGDNGTNGDNGFDFVGLLLPIIGLIVVIAIIYFIYTKFSGREE